MTDINPHPDLLPTRWTRARASAVTLVLVALNVGVYLAQVLQGVHWLEPKNVDLLKWGANLSALTLYGDNWRLLTSMFLHGGILHLGMNMYMLLMMGALLERRVGSLRTAVIYMTAGVAGSAASAWWHAVHTVSSVTLSMGVPMTTEHLAAVVSVGASGAVMGLVGALLMTALRPPAHEVDGGRMAKALLQVIGLNLVLGWVISGIDQAAHVGGALAGVLGGAVLVAVETQRAAWLRAVAVAVVLAMGLAIVVGVSHLPRSAELDKLHEELMAESRQVEAERLAAQRQQERQRLIEADAKAAPPPVDEAQARGRQIELGLKEPDWISAYTLSPDGQRVYLADVGSNRLVSLNLSAPDSLRVVAGRAFPQDKRGGCTDNMCRGLGASAVALSADEHWAYVASMEADALAIVNLGTGRVEASVKVGRFPRAVVLSPDGQRAFVLNAVDNTVSVVDLASRTTVGAPLPLQGGDAGNLPFGRTVGLWMDATHERLYALDGVAGAVEAYSARSLQREATLPDAGVGLVALSANGKVLLMAGGERLELRDTHTHTVRHTALCDGQGTQHLALSADGALLAVETRHKVRIVKLDTGRTIAAFPIADDVTQIGFSADGQHLLVLRSDGALTVLDRQKSLDVNALLENEGEFFCGLT